jgi:hypothetical protein
MKMKLITFSFATILLSSMASVHGTGGLTAMFVTKLSGINQAGKHKVASETVTKISSEVAISFYEQEIVKARKKLKMKSMTPDFQLLRIYRMFKAKNTPAKIMEKIYAGKNRKSIDWAVERFKKMKEIDALLTDGLIKYATGLRTKAKVIGRYESI